MVLRWKPRAWQRIVGMVLACWLYGAVAVSHAPVAAAKQAILPPNFHLGIVTEELHLPTDMVLLPSGDILITEKGRGLGTGGVAEVRLIRQGQLVEDPVMSLSVTVIGDSGVYGLTLDPSFSVNHYFYIWYSIGEQARDWPGQSVNRLSRFVFDPHTGKADALDETIILDGVRWSQWHNGGALAFDNAGNLLLATGDAAQFHLPQALTSLNGKLLRIRPGANGDYSVPADNPFVDDATALPEIYALGLRNPFRLAWNPVDQGYYLLDVGADDWEEVNLVEAGANYGWPEREGPCPFRATGDACTPAPAKFTDPVVAFPHPVDGSAGVTSLAFYTGTTWPEEYQGDLFLADFNTQALYHVDVATPQTINLFGDDVGNLVDIEPTEAGLYTLSINDGATYLIYYAADGNQPPTAQVAASPVQGAAPLAVGFSTEGSADPEGEALTYWWDFGDGTAPISATQTAITHTYMSDGDYTASLYVEDAQGGRSATQRVEIQVYSGEMPAIAQEIVGASYREDYRGGDTVRFTVTRVAGTDDLDPDVPYRWSIRQHHNEHLHFIVTDYAGSEVEFEIADDSHAADVTLWYEAELTMLTAAGQAVQISRALLPDVVSVNALSSPAGAALLWNGVPQPPNLPIDAVVGQQYTLAAPLVLYSGPAKYTFARWQVIEGGAGDEEDIPEQEMAVVAAINGPRYVAHYEFTAPATVNYLPNVINGSTAEQ